MKIKVGDKVRVSKDAPKVYSPKEEDGTVMGIDGEDALIKSECTGMPHCSPFWVLAIPTKYLVKVNAEAKEPKLKVGDWVKIDEVPNPQLNGRVGAISRIDKEGYKISFNDGFFTVVSEEDLTLVDEPTEAEKNANEELQEVYARFMSGRTPITLADRPELAHIQRRMRVLSQDDFLKINPAEHEVNPKIMFNTEFWVKYEADLAREIAVMLVRTHRNDLNKVAKMSVDIAKAVVENLKQK